METRSKDGLVVHRAKWILPVASPPIENGAILSFDGKILEVDRADKISTGTDASVIDIEDGVIIPGLINAHTHLEFSDLQSPLGTSGMSFTNWISEVIRQRSGQGGSNAESSKQAAIGLGLRELVATGTVAVGEIATGTCNASKHLTDLSSNRLHVTAFLEQLGRNEELFRQRAEEAVAFLDSAKEPSDAVSINGGLSPHAPYSVHPQLLNQLVDQAKLSNVPLAMHLAETREEIQLIENQKGPFVDLLESLGAWKPETFSKGANVLSILQTLADAPSALIIHGNFLTNLELDFLQNQPSMSVVFCPRTHSYFGHPTYPIEAILDRRINLAIGTDSRASNPDLSLLAEMKHIASVFPQFSHSTILELGTQNGARALGLSSTLGSIKAGKSNHLSVVKTSQLETATGWIHDSDSTAVQLLDECA